MGQSPAVIIIARHGARLDAADKNWHLTTATPYDPPLTYGGWLQSRSLGNRIGSILQQREAACGNQSVRPVENNNVAPQNPDGLAKTGLNRKQRIIIHSSPFIRCVQTAVAISAGIGQFRKTVATDTPRSRPVFHSRSPLLRTGNNSPQLTAIPEPEHLHISPLIHHNQVPARRRIAQLRIDAFLGEWLCRDYFENITPPPSSVLMVASAKAELLRQASETANIATSRKSSLGHFPGGWSRDRSSARSTDEDEKTNLTQMAVHSQSLPRRVNTINLGNEARSGVKHDCYDSFPAVFDSYDEDVGYTPPIPTYAISNSNPIPMGYVAHAQDACVDVEYQWDSMRPPRDWGTGGEYGEYGEEWSTMHKRFRNGLQRMLAWYEEQDTSFSVANGSKEEDDDDDDDADTVLILVTHGAGCNALIGALTNQPVLHDIGMASLTMAVRKSEPGVASPRILQSPQPARRGSTDLSIANKYKMELTASTEHLRNQSNALRMPSPRQDAPFFGANRRPSGSPFIDVPPSGAIRSGLTNGLHRSASGSHGLRPYPTSTRSKLSSGLWGSETLNTHSAVSESSSSDSLPNFEGPSAVRQNRGGQAEATGPDALQSQAMSHSVGTAVQKGLWAGRFDHSPKRRWTSANH